jgi:hypothetical protein
MIDQDNKKTDQFFLSDREKFVLRGAVLLLCVTILALVFM